MNRALVLLALIVAAYVLPNVVGNRTTDLGSVLGRAQQTQTDRREAQVRYLTGETPAAPGTTGAEPAYNPARGSPSRRPGDGAIPTRLRGAIPAARPWAVSMRGFFETHGALISLCVWAAFMALCGVSCICIAASRYGVARWCCSQNLHLGAAELAAVSLCSVVCHLAGLNFFGVVSPLLWASPLLFVLASVWLFSMLDPNYPFWPEAFQAVSLPIFASGMILGWDIVMPQLTRLFPGLG